MFTLWDVEHGLAIWIQTPNGQSHCIDAGKNNDTEFSPYKLMRTKYKVTNIDYLIISHPDRDHIEGLPSLIEHIGEPRVFCRNKSLPDEEKYGDCQLEYIETFKCFDKQYTFNVDYANSPRNTCINGNVHINTLCNKYQDGMSKNDLSIVAFYKFKDHLFVMPGDIETKGWSMLREQYMDKLQSIKKGTKTVTLVAPHHGRSSAYSREMIDDLSPNLILISDKFAKHETDKRYYSAGTGLLVSCENTCNSIFSLSTKTKGRIRITINQQGIYTINWDNKNWTLVR